MVISQCLRSACHLRVVGLPDQISPSFVTMPIATFVFDSRSTIEIVWFNVFTHAQLAALVWQTPDEDRPSTEVHDKAMAVPIAIVSFGHKEHKHLMQGMLYRSCLIHRKCMNSTYLNTFFVACT